MSRKKQTRISMHHRASVRANRQGALLICVIVVLGLVCMIAVQSTRTMVTLEQANRRSGGIQQAREILNLGKAVLANELNQDPSASVLEWKVEVEEGDFASIVASVVEAKEANVKTGETPAEVERSFRIEVRYPIESVNEIKVSEVVLESEI